MNFKTILLLAVAIGLYALSRSLELRGDAAPLAAHGVSPERAKFHIMALVLLLGAIGSFVCAGLGAFRNRHF
jgi:hypothetical protein